MAQSGARYETKGNLFQITVIKGQMFIVGLAFEDYNQLLAQGFKDEEVHLTIKKARFGDEYSQMVPELKVRASLCTIMMEKRPKFQLTIEPSLAEEMIARGFKDLEEVDLVIEQSPYRMPSKPLDPKDLRIDDLGDFKNLGQP